MRQSQSFTIRPNGAVKGGSASYTFDSDTGGITYRAEITVGVWPFSKTKKVSGTYIADPPQALSSRFTKQGDVSAIGPMIFEVALLIPGGADLNLKIDGRPEKGTAVIDTGAQYIRLKQLVAEVPAPVLGTLTIEADAIGPTRAPRRQPRSVFDALFGELWGID